MSNALSPLFSASYFSQSQIKPDGDASLMALVQAASARNETLGITGALFFREGCFFQWLEGPEDAVVELLRKIERDPRHRKFQVVHTQHRTPRRLFPSWGMSGTVVDERLGEDAGFLDTLRRIAVSGASGVEFGKAFLGPAPGTDHGGLQIVALSSSQLWLNPLLAHLSARGGLPRSVRWYRSVASPKEPLSLEEVSLDDDVLGPITLTTVPRELLDSPLAPLLLERDALVFMFRRDLAEEKLPWIRKAFDLCLVRRPPPVVCCVMPPSVQTLRDGIQQLAEERDTAVYFCGVSILMGSELWQSLRQGIADERTRLRAQYAAVVPPSSTPFQPPTLPLSDALPARSITPTGQTAALPKKDDSMSDVNSSLDELMQIEGALGVVLADYTSGMVLGMKGGGVNLELAAAGNTEVIRAKMKTMQTLGLDDRIEDMLITLGKQIHIIRPLVKAPNLFVYIVLEKNRSNLAMARYKVAAIEATLKV